MATTTERNTAALRMMAIDQQSGEADGRLHGGRAAN